MKPPSLWIWAFLPAIGTVLWKVVDANPALFLYDLFSSVGSTSTLNNQTIWITGGSSGIGASLVCKLVQVEAKSVILSARNIDQMDQVVQKCQTKYPESPTILSIVRYDALDSNKTADVVRSAIKASGGNIDMLILNSGVYQLKPALDTSIEETRRLSRINYEAPVELYMELIRQNQWKARGYGHLVVSSSVMAKGPQPLCSSYAASKAALKNYFQTLSTEEFSWLTVQVAMIGGTRTQMWQNLNYGANKPDDSTLMNPDRVAELLVRAFSSPYWLLFSEVWVTKNIGLLYIYLSMYLPTLHTIMTHALGVARRISYERDGGDVLDLKTICMNLAGAWMERK